MEVTRDNPVALGGTCLDSGFCELEFESHLEMMLR